MTAVIIVILLGIFSVSYSIVHILRHRSKKESDWLEAVPGPTGLPIIGNLVDLVRAGYEADLLLMRWAKEYGRIFQFRMGTKCVYVLNDFEIISEAWHHPEIQGRPRFSVIAKLLGPGLGIVTGTGDSWKEHRRFFLNSLRKFGLGKRSFEDGIADEAGRITENISRQEGRPMDVSNTFSLASCNIISSLVFGRRLDHDDPRLIREVRAIEQSVRNAGLAVFNSSIAYFGKGKIFLKANRAIKEMWDASIRQHFLSSAPEPRDIIDEYIERLRGAETHFTESNLRWFVRDIYLAGTETVSTTLQWATLLLMTHPEVQRRCQDEIDSVVGRDRYATTADRVHTPYLNATIQEILRVGNIVPLGVPHETTAEVRLGGYHIPQGSIVVSNATSVMTDPVVWPEPGAFKPERFLDEEGNFVKSEKIIPFGIGKRVCAGEQLAKIELYVLLTRLLHQFNILPPSEGAVIPNINQGTTGFTRSPLPYTVRFIKRLY